MLVLKEAIESFFSFFIYRPRSYTKNLLGFPLWLLSGLYFLIRQWQLITATPAKKAPIPLISVGNLTVGGSGKTPLTLFLARYLNQSKKVAVLCRGYKSEAEKSQQPVLVRDPKGLYAEHRACGDEPLLLATHLKKSWIYAGACREKSLLQALKEGVEVAVLDDAFQNTRLPIDIQLVIIREKDLRSSHDLLPFGPFREPISALKRCDFLLVNLSAKNSCKQEVKDLVAPHYSGPLAMLRMESGGHLNDGKQSFPLSAMAEKPCLCFAGIAHPQAFFAALKEQAPTLCLHTLHFHDHQDYQKKQLLQIEKKRLETGSQALICTEKDWVKLKNYPFSVPLYYVDLSIHFDSGKEQFMAFLEERLSLKNI